MAIQTTTTASERSGVVLGEYLVHAAPIEVLGITGMQKPFPKNSGKQMKFRRWLPYGGAAATPNTWSVTAAAHITTEGVTPAADTITPQDVTVNLQQYMCLYSFSDQTVDHHEDGAVIPQEMKVQTGERMGLVRELVRYAALKGSTNKFYAGGTTRATVDEKITSTFLRNITKAQKAQHAKFIRGVLDPSEMYGTAAVEAAYLAFCHTAVESDIRDLPKFTPVAEYGTRKTVHEQEIGSWENFRFIVSPELAGHADSGAAIGTTGLESTTGTSIDVYPVVIVAQDAWCSLSTRDTNAMEEIWLPANKKDKSDPGGQRGYVGAKFYFASVVTNNYWVAIGEVGVTDLTP